MTDLRLPLGVLLAFYGVILIATGASAGTLVVGININLWWGSVLLIFGIAMVLLARRAATTIASRARRGSRSG
jgi:hypothetical protein